MQARKQTKKGKKQCLWGFLHGEQKVKKDGWVSRNMHKGDSFVMWVRESVLLHKWIPLPLRKVISMTEEASSWTAIGLQLPSPFKCLLTYPCILVRLILHQKWNHENKGIQNIHWTKISNEITIWLFVWVAYIHAYVWLRCH